LCVQNDKGEETWKRRDSERGKKRRGPQLKTFSRRSQDKSVKDRRAYSVCDSKRNVDTEKIKKFCLVELPGDPMRGHEFDDENKEEGAASCNQACRNDCEKIWTLLLQSIPFRRVARIPGSGRENIMSVVPTPHGRGPQGGGL
jgi:hypothetical protein